MDKSREDFEDYFEDSYGWEAGDYPNQTYVTEVWNMWQASRKALVSSISADDIKRIFIANGFKEKSQHDGRLDLNNYVYDSALALLEDVAGITVKGEGDDTQSQNSA